MPYPRPHLYDVLCCAEGKRSTNTTDLHVCQSWEQRSRENRDILAQATLSLVGCTRYMMLLYLGFASLVWTQCVLGKQGTSDMNSSHITSCRRITRPQSWRLCLCLTTRTREHPVGGTIKLGLILFFQVTDQPHVTQCLCHFKRCPQLVILLFVGGIYPFPLSSKGGIQVLPFSFPLSSLTALPSLWFSHECPPWNVPGRHRRYQVFGLLCT